MKQAKEITAEVRVSKVIDHYWRPFIMVLGVVLFVGLGWMGYSFYLEKKEKTAQEELYTLSRSIEKQSESLGKDATKTPEALAKNFATQLKEYDQFIGRTKGLKASSMAAIQVAQLAQEYGDWPRAEKVLKVVLPDSRDSDLFYGLVRAQLATNYFNQNQPKEALTLLEDIVKSQKQKHLHAQSLLRIGVGYMELGEQEKAKATFKRISAEFAESQAAQEAKTFQKMIRSNKGA